LWAPYQAALPHILTTLTSVIKEGLFPWQRLNFSATKLM
jgi:hypothetical protein